MTVLTFTAGLLGGVVVAICGYLLFGVIPIAIVDSLDKKKEDPENEKSR